MEYLRNDYGLEFLPEDFTAAKKARTTDLADAITKEREDRRISNNATFVKKRKRQLATLKERSTKKEVISLLVIIVQDKHNDKGL